jgi:hypothetical protein
MADKQHISFSFALTDKKGYNSDKVFGMSVSEEIVPEGKNGVVYLRERVLYELDRLMPK